MILITKNKATPTHKNVDIIRFWCLHGRVTECYSYDGIWKYQHYASYNVRKLYTYAFFKHYPVFCNMQTTMFFSDIL